MVFRLGMAWDGPHIRRRYQQSGRQLSNFVYVWSEHEGGKPAHEPGPALFKVGSGSEPRLQTARTFMKGRIWVWLLFVYSAPDQKEPYEHVAEQKLLNHLRQGTVPGIRMVPSRNTRSSNKKTEWFEMDRPIEGMERIAEVMKQISPRYEYLLRFYGDTGNTGTMEDHTDEREKTTASGRRTSNKFARTPNQKALSRRQQQEAQRRKRLGPKGITPQKTRAKTKQYKALVSRRLKMT